MPKRGKELVIEKDDWDILFDSLMTGIITVAALVIVIPRLSVVQQAQQYFTSQSYQGDVETRVLSATGVLKYLDLIKGSPYTPLISAFFINRGPNTVYIGINAARDWLEIQPWETRTVSHIGADKRIEIIFYKCDIGQTALVEVEGHF